MKSKIDCRSRNTQTRCHATGQRQRARHSHVSRALLLSTLLVSNFFASVLFAPVHASTVGIPAHQAKPHIDSENPALTAGLRGGLGNGGGCKVPTDGDPSPLFGAQSFSNKMLRFEEFGNRALAADESYAQCKQDYDSKLPGFCPSLPEPNVEGPSKGGTYNAYASPDHYMLDKSMDSPLYPFPTREARTDHPNPWQKAIEEEHTGKLEPLVSSNPSKLPL